MSRHAHSREPARVDADGGEDGHHDVAAAEAVGEQEAQAHRHRVNGEGRQSSVSYKVANTHPPANIITYREYAEGKHASPVTLTSDHRALILAVSLGAPFFVCTSWC